MSCIKHEFTFTLKCEKYKITKSMETSHNFCCTRAKCGHHCRMKDLSLV